MKIDTSILNQAPGHIDTSMLEDTPDAMTPEALAYGEGEEVPDLTVSRLLRAPVQEIKKSIADYARGSNLPSAYARSEKDLARVSREEMIDRTFSPQEVEDIRAEIQKHRSEGIDLRSARHMAIGKVAQKRGQDAQDLIRAHEQTLPDLPSDDAIKASRAKRVKSNALLEAVANSRHLQMDPEFERSSGVAEDIARGLGSSVVPFVAMLAHPVLGAHVMYEQIKGAKYEALVNDGVDPDRANLAASRDAIAQTPLEFISDMFALKAVLGGGRAWSKLITDIAASAGAEGLTEFAQQYPDDLSTLWAMNPDLTIKEAWDSMTSMDQLKRSAYAGLIGGAVGGIMAGGGHATARGLDRFILEPQRRKNEERASLLLGAVKKLKEGGALNTQEQDLVSSLDVPQAMIDRMYMQSPVDTENRDKVYDGLLKSNITREQADATITIIDAIAHHYAEVTGETPEAFYDTELIDYQVMKYGDFNTDEERKAAQTRTQYQDGDEIEIDVESLSRDVLNRMNKTLKSMGYDTRGSDAIKEMLLKRNGRLWNPDWITAYRRATEGVGLARQKKEQKKKYEHIDRSRLRKLGYTNDLREAGYITPAGNLIDLSGKREGGQPGYRSYDHREAGGTNGMQEFMAEGNIRMDHNAGSVDLVSLPTSKQLSILDRIIREHNGKIIIDLWDGLGEQRDSYYLEPERTFSMEYKEGTKPAKIINDIKTFYAGKIPHAALFQAGPSSQPLGATVFTSSGAIISAFEGNNPSTAIHEVGHLLTDLISRYDPESFAILAKYVGKDPAAGLGAWTTTDHERTAKAFETYLMQGKAPSFRLARVFKQFKKWLLEIYRRVTKLGTKVTPEVRSVFDKWLTTEEERSMDFMSDMTNLMDESSPYYAELKKLSNESIESYADLAAKAETLVRDKDKGKRLAAIKKEKEYLKGLAAEYVDGDVFYHDVKEYLWPHRISEKSVRAMRNYSEDEIQILKEKKVISKTGKRSADEFVHELVFSFGERPYNAGEEFLDMAIDKPSRADAIEMKYQDLLGHFEEGIEADGILLDDAQDIIDTELQILYAMLGKSPARSRILSREVKKIEELSFDDIRDLKKLASDLDRSAREAFDEGRKEEKGIQKENMETLKDKKSAEIAALKEKQKGKMETARAKWLEKVIALKEKQKEAVRKVREQNKISQQKKKIIARLKKHVRRKGLIYENRQQLLALLARYFKVGRYMPDPKMPTLEGYFASRVDPDLQAGEMIQEMILSLPEPRRDTDGNSLTQKRWTLADLEAIGDVSDLIISMDVQERSNTEAVRQQERANLIDHLYDSAGKAPKVLESGEIKVRPRDTWYKTAKDLGSRLYTGLTKIEFLCNWLDGFSKVGLTWTRIFKPLADAENAELLMHKTYDAKITAIMRDLVGDNAWFKQAHVLPGVTTRISRMNAFMIALNSGNEHNRNYLTEGNLIPDTAIDFIWDEFLTEQEKKAVNEVWDLFDTLFPMLDDINKKLVGIPLKKVEGHYFPIKTDTKFSEMARKQEELQSARDIGFGPSWFAYPEHGFRKERVKSMQEYPPLLLEASMIATHLDRVIHDVTHTMPILDVYRLIRDPGVMRAIKDVAGEEMYDQFTPWLRSISRPMSEPLGLTERMMKHLRRTTSIVGMGFKMSVTALQPLDLTSTVYELGEKATMQGLRDFYSNPLRMSEEIKAKSIMMRYRARAYDREVNDFKRRVLLKGDAWDKMNDYYFATISTLDYAVAYPTWLAAYNVASKKYTLPDGSVDEEMAVDFADSTVRRVLGAGRAKDLPNEMKGSEMKKFWTMFYTWANKFENQMMEVSRKTGREGLKDPRKIAELMKAMVWLIAIPAYLSMFLYKRRLPEDEEWATWLLAYRLQGIPAVRDIMGFLSGYDTRMPLSGAVQSLAQVGRDFAKVKGYLVDDKEVKWGALAEHLGTAAGYTFGLPTSQAFITLDGALALASGESDNPLDLLFRPPRKEKQAVAY